MKTGDRRGVCVRREGGREEGKSDVDGWIFSLPSCSQWKPVRRCPRLLDLRLDDCALAVGSLAHIAFFTCL